MSCHSAAVHGSGCSHGSCALLIAQGQKEKKLAAEIANGRLAMMAPSSVLGVNLSPQ